MEAILKVKLATTSLTIFVSGNFCEGHTVKYWGSPLRSTYRKSYFQCHWGKYEENCQNVSVRAATGFQMDYGRDDIMVEPPTIYKRQGDHSRQNADKARTPNQSQEGSKATRGSSTSWPRLAGVVPPFDRNEELSLSADVQDMLLLESQKDELEKELGREPTVDEWAGYCGISIFKLYARIGKGRAAKRKMIAANLPLVNSVAERFHGRGLSHVELCQEGVQGLERSTEKYDTSFNTKFSSYSFMWIWQKMHSGVKKFRHVLRISQTVYDMSSVLLRQKEEFQILHGRSPSLQELADVSHLGTDTIQNVLRLLRPVRSMDEPASNLEIDYEKQIEDQNRGGIPWTNIMESELRKEITRALLCLTPREQRVLELRYGLCGEPPQGRAQENLKMHHVKHLRESKVGLALELTYESIRLIEKKALDKLRHLAKEDGLQQYLSTNMWAE